MKISVIVITFNEASNISDCLQSVAWADEIIVVDSFSTDDTAEIVKSLNAKIFFNEWHGYSDQKRFALSKASNEWILSIDADERISENLRDEILNLAVENIDGYKIKRENYFLNKHIQTCGWNKDYQLRLFRKDKVAVTNRLVHEGFEVDGKIGILNNNMIHFTHQTISDTLKKINDYSSLQAQELYEEKKITRPGIILHTISAFLRYYFSLKGFKDGMHGFIVSLSNALTTLLTYVKIWELKNNNKNI